MLEPGWKKLFAVNPTAFPPRPSRPRSRATLLNFSEDRVLEWASIIKLNYLHIETESPARSSILSPLFFILLLPFSNHLRFISPRDRHSRTSSTNPIQSPKRRQKHSLTEFCPNRSPAPRTALKHSHKSYNTSPNNPNPGKQQYKAGQETLYSSTYYTNNGHVLSEGCSSAPHYPYKLRTRTVNTSSDITCPRTRSAKRSRASKQVNSQQP